MHREVRTHDKPFNIRYCLTQKCVRISFFSFVAVKLCNEIIETNNHDKIPANLFHIVSFQSNRSQQFQARQFSFYDNQNLLRNKSYNHQWNGVHILKLKRYKKEHYFCVSLNASKHANGKLTRCDWPTANLYNDGVTRNSGTDINKLLVYPTVTCRNLFILQVTANTASSVSSGWSTAWQQYEPY